jgi:predicted RNA-binding Zn-ribbon protein involved in translation (DUF1610 family)
MTSSSSFASAARVVIGITAGAGEVTGVEVEVATELVDHKCASCGNIQQIDIDRVQLGPSGEVELICDECGENMPSSLSVALKSFCAVCGETYEQGTSCTECGDVITRSEFEITCSGCGSVEQIEQSLMRINSAGLVVAKCDSCTQIRLVKGEIWWHDSMLHFLCLKPLVESPVP